jgi:hypothetical protein
MLRRVVSVLAVLGVLLHAGAVARHQTLMVQAWLQHSQLAADLLSICNSSGQTKATDLPTVPRPTDAQNGCPVCAGLLSVAVLLPAEQVVLPLEDGGGTISRPPIGAAASLIVAHERPPARGPPLAA